ncbi:hypothetical protein VIGAN_08279900, partial [Vigna angularis var. angularis]
FFIHVRKLSPFSIHAKQKHPRLSLTMTFYSHFPSLFLVFSDRKWHHSPTTSSEDASIKPSSFPATMATIGAINEI